MASDAFVGWCRPAGGAWSAVCVGPTWDECWACLIRHDVGGNCEKIVIEEGRRPEDRRKVRRKRGGDLFPPNDGGDA